MSLDKILQISGSGMISQSTRLNTIASNISNADSISSSAGTAYKARKPVFSATMQDVQNDSLGVQVLGIIESDAPNLSTYKPDHPLADENGMVYGSNVNVMEEMADLIAASRSYQDNVEIASMAQQLLLKTLNLGQG